MTVEEIFNKLGAHMVEGIMIHDQMCNAYNFLGLCGFSALHAHQHIEETKCYIELSHYYTTRFHKLINLGVIENPKIIPENWYKYTTMNVDAGTRKNAVKEMMTKWVKWEQDTKKLYSEMRQQLCIINEVGAALELGDYIRDVDRELMYAEKKLLKLESLNYETSAIISCSEKLEKKYKE